MKHALAKVDKKAIVKKIPGAIWRYASDHRGAFLTGGTIAFNAAGIAATYKNSPKIHEIISEARSAIRNLNPGEDELSKQIIRGAVVEVGKLAAPIIMFFAASTTCAIVNERKNEKTIAGLTAALSLAQGTIQEYEQFKEEVKKEVGDENFETIHREAQKQVVQQEMESLEARPNPGEKLFYIRYLGCYFSSSSKDKVEATMRDLSRILYDNDLKNWRGTIGRDENGNNVVVMSMTDICRELGVKEEDIPEVAADIRFKANVESPADGDLRWMVGTIEKNDEPIYALIIEPNISYLKDFF